MRTYIVFKSCWLKPQHKTRIMHFYVCYFKVIDTVSLFYLDCSNLAFSQEQMLRLDNADFVVLKGDIWV